MDYQMGFGAALNGPSKPGFHNKDNKDGSHQLKLSIADSKADDESPHSNILDLETNLLVTGMYHVQLLQLPLQPRRFHDYTVALRNNTYIT